MKNFFKNDKGNVKVGWKIFFLLLASFVVNMVWQFVTTAGYQAVYMSLNNIKEIKAEIMNEILAKSPLYIAISSMGSLLTILVVVLFIKKLDKKTLRDTPLGIKNRSGFSKFLIGSLLACISTVILTLFGVGVGLFKLEAAKELHYGMGMILGFIVCGLFVSIISGISEEVLYRGYILDNLIAVNKKSALVVSALIFVLQDVFGSLKFIDVIGLFLAGIFFGYLYLTTSSLAITAGFHSTLHFLLLNVVKLQEYDFFKGPSFLNFTSNQNIEIFGVTIGSAFGISTVFINLLSIIVLYFYNKRFTTQKEVEMIN